MSYCSLTGAYRGFQKGKGRDFERCCVLRNEAPRAELEQGQGPGEGHGTVNEIYLRPTVL